MTAPNLMMAQYPVMGQPPMTSPPTMSTAGGRQVLADLALVTIARHRTLYSIPAESLCLAAHPTEPRTAGVAGGLPYLP